MDFRETCITRIYDDDHVGVYTSEKKFVNAIYRLKKAHPDEVVITKVNQDGSVCANFPYDWLKFPAPKRKVSDAARKVARERMTRMWQETKAEEGEK